MPVEDIPVLIAENVVTKNLFTSFYSTEEVVQWIIKVSLIGDHIRRFVDILNVIPYRWPNTKLLGVAGRITVSAYITAVPLKRKALFSPRYSAHQWLLNL